MLKTDLDHKIFMAQGFLDTARLHELTQNCVIGESREEADKKKDDALLGKKLVTHFLYALVFELSIKIIHEIEMGRRHHVIIKFRFCTKTSLQQYGKRFLICMTFKSLI